MTGSESGSEAFWSGFTWAFDSAATKGSSWSSSSEVEVNSEVEEPQQPPSVWLAWVDDGKTPGLLLVEDTLGWRIREAETRAQFGLLEEVMMPGRSLLFPVVVVVGDDDDETGGLCCWSLLLLGSKAGSFDEIWVKFPITNTPLELTGFEGGILGRGVENEMDSVAAAAAAVAMAFNITPEAKEAGLEPFLFLKLLAVMILSLMLPLFFLLLPLLLLLLLFWFPFFREAASDDNEDGEE
jgi:hypothetical protein